MDIIEIGRPDSTEDDGVRNQSDDAGDEVQ